MMGRKGVLLTLMALLFIVGVGLVIWPLTSGAGSSTDIDPDDATACELETRRPQRGVLSVAAHAVGNGKQKVTFTLRSLSGTDSFWYAASIHPPLKDHPGQRVFNVRSEPTEMDTIEFDLPAGNGPRPELRIGRLFHSHAFLTQQQVAAIAAEQPVTGRYPLATSSHVTQVNGDTGKRRTHLTSHGSGQAVDLKAPPGTEVRAFGAGKVVSVEDGYDDRLRCGAGHANRYTNAVWVLQDDGYEAGYGHLQMDSSLVALGMRVEAGQPLAQLGRYNGSSGGAHLHFQLGGMTERGLVSVPVAFEDQEGGSVIVPREGQAIDFSGRSGPDR